MPADLDLKLCDLCSVAAEQVEHVLTGTDRALDATKGIRVDEPVNALVRHEHLVGRRCETFAECRRLSRNVVRTSSHYERGVVRCQRRQPSQNSD